MDVNLEDGKQKTFTDSECRVNNITNNKNDDPE
jgi:hypothetical protein